MTNTHLATSTVRHLKDHTVRPGERWIYSAGFNVGPELREPSRIDCELDDLRWIVGAGGRVAILSHQGSHKDGSARHIEYVAEYLTARLGFAVPYFPESASDAAVARSAAMRNGEVVLFGNTRLLEGEERNDGQLAGRLARLGDRVAIGGFSKAHRAHASNVGVLAHLEGYAASSLVDGVARLSVWAGAVPQRPSVAILGGSKIEKTEIGFECFTRLYDVVIPGGTVLNAILRSLGYDVGESALGEAPDRARVVIDGVLGRASCARLLLPESVVVARRHGREFRDPQVVPVDAGVPAGHAIVDFLVSEEMAASLRRAANRNGRVLIAGPPCLTEAGFTTASGALMQLARDPRLATILLGGDTNAALPFDGPRSTGGGAALRLLCEGDCAVLRALRRQTALSM
jgi:phosphoglycerate kinase